MLDTLQWLRAIRYLWLGSFIKLFLNLLLPAEISHYVSVIKLLSLSALHLPSACCLLCQAKAGTACITFLLSQQSPRRALPTGAPGRVHSRWREKGPAPFCWSVRASWLCWGHPYFSLPWPRQLSPPAAVESSFHFTNTGRISLVQLPQRHQHQEKQCPRLNSLGPGPTSPRSTSFEILVIPPSSCGCYSVIA